MCQLLEVSQLTLVHWLTVLCTAQFSINEERLFLVRCCSKKEVLPYLSQVGCEKSPYTLPGLFSSQVWVVLTADLFSSQVWVVLTADLSQVWVVLKGRPFLFSGVGSVKRETFSLLRCG